MAHKITVLSGCAAGCLGIVATIAIVLAQPNEPTVVYSQPPTTLPGETLPGETMPPPPAGARGLAGVPALAERVSRASLIVRAAVEQVGEPDSDDVAAQAPIRYKVIRFLKGNLPENSTTLTVPTVASFVSNSSELYAIGKEQILILEQYRGRNGQLLTRELSVNYDSGPGRLDEVEQQILELVGHAEQPLIPDIPRPGR